MIEDSSVMEIGQRLYTVEEFEAIADAPENRERLLELINGEIIEKVPTEEHGLCTGNIYGPIWNYLQQHKIGRVVMEVRHRNPDDDYNALQPDISFRAGKPELVKKGAVPQMPDLAVEVKSPTDSLRKLREKARYYIQHGSKLAWLVNPEKQFVEVYTPHEDYVLGIDDTLSGGEVLPGFMLPVRRIFSDTISEE
jgi:Uma2 family endonuclease